MRTPQSANADSSPMKGRLSNQASPSQGRWPSNSEVGGVLPVHNTPTIVCCDLWPRSTLTQAKLDAYKRLINMGDIKIRRVIHHKATGYTTVEYWSNIPHAWTLNRLRELTAVLDQGTQMEVELQLDERCQRLR